MLLGGSHGKDRSWSKGWLILHLSLFTTTFGCKNSQVMRFVTLPRVKNPHSLIWLCFYCIIESFSQLYQQNTVCLAGSRAWGMEKLLVIIHSFSLIHSACVYEKNGAYERRKSVYVQGTMDQWPYIMCIDRYSHTLQKSTYRWALCRTLGLLRWT